MITLHGGGPYNNTLAHDTGDVKIRMSIHLKAEGCRTRVGAAVYERDPSNRNVAFFLRNEWDGELVKRVKKKSK